MTRYRQPTIQEQGGLLVYLDGLREENNGYSGTQVIGMLDSKASNTSIGNIVGRLPSTIRHWRKVRKEEMNSGKSQSMPAVQTTAPEHRS